MFTYLHRYVPETWDAYEKAGFVRREDGINFPQSIQIDEWRKFNNLAAKGGKLWNILNERRTPFYIDRLQGGCFIEDYPYDMELINAYREMLGDNFWGFQMHEWMSNFMSDFNKVRSNGIREWTEEAIIETIQRAYPMSHLFLEAMNARELAENGIPEDALAFLQDAERLYEKRQKFTNGDLLPVDSFFPAYNLAVKYKTKRWMPEVGAQTHDTRMQIAYARGMAHAHNIPFGAYYEPWRGDPCCVCCYQREGKNEWNIRPNSNDFPFSYLDENGGSSRSMQWRIHLYSYFAGAEFISEEWGLCNTFYDWNDFEISPYGQVKLDFIRFVDRYPDVGRIMTPIAIVIPEDMPALDSIHSSPGSYVGFPVYGSYAERIQNVRNGLSALLRASTPMIGSEQTSLLNFTIPDALDIVHEGSFHPEAYEYAVDLTGNPAFAKNYANKICKIEDVPVLLDALLPVKVNGAVHHLINRCSDGSYYLLMLNNNGVMRTIEHGEQFLSEADVDVSVDCAALQLQVLEGDGTVCEKDGDRYYIHIPAGGWLLAKLG